jgi:formylglycine-generating enzyme required for sulfatase activity
MSGTGSQTRFLLVGTLLVLALLPAPVQAGPGDSTQPELAPPDTTTTTTYPGWNLISLARDPGDRAIATLTAGETDPTGLVYRDAAYSETAELGVGEGTWLYQPGPGVQIVLGAGDTDSDGDGVSDADEIAAGTDPYLYLATIRPGWNILSVSSQLTDAAFPDLFGRFVADTGWHWDPFTLRYDVATSVSSVEGVWLWNAYPDETVRIVYDARRYMVIDITTDRGGRASFSVSYQASLPLLNTAPAADLYRTSKIVLRRIPRGTYAMGSPGDESGRADDETQHTVTLTEDLYVGVFEITRAQWELVTGTIPSNEMGLADDCPIHAVSWDAVRGGTWPDGDPDASSFIGALRAGLPDVVGLDLPTEAQWEYACRARTTLALNDHAVSQGFGAPDTGTDLSTALSPLGWFADNSDGAPQPVGGLQPNAWGLYDMHGNAAEWCLDYANGDDYGPADCTDPVGPTESTSPFGVSRIIRGGDFLEPAANCRSAARQGYLASARRAETRIGPGFRLVACGYTISSRSEATSTAVTRADTTTAEPTVVASASRPSRATVELSAEELLALLQQWARLTGIPLAELPADLVDLLTTDAWGEWFARIWPAVSAALR